MDPYAGHAASPGARRVVTFLRERAPSKVPLPLEADGARVLGLVDREAFTVYTPHSKGAVFMVLIAKAFGVNATTRTWETVTRCAGA